ncbi:unnamed protein product [Tilletia controversa]|nr:unnamed protein product [Tilletia controversa]
MPATRKEKETKKKKRRVDGRPSDPAPGQSSKKIKRTGHPPPAPATPQNGSTSKSITETPSGPEDKPANWPTEVWARGTGEVLGFERDVGLGIDATYAGNLGRFINDFRGIAQRANVTFEDWPSSASSEGGERNQPRGLALYTGPAGVAAGAELCVSYGKAFWEARGVLPATGTASRPP